MNDIARIAEGLDPPFVLADVGGRWGPGDAWRALAPPVRIVGFEADGEECARLRAANDNEALSFEPVALGARAETAVLHVTEHPACSSLYEPDERVIADHPQLAMARKVGERPVRVQRLDDWCAVRQVGVDALKLDVQGAELDVLRGAERQLQRVVMLEVEVEFNPIYRGQPLFGDVDRFLRARGFVLWRLAHLAHYGRRGLDSTTSVVDLQAFDSRPMTVAGQGGQLYWGHAHYVAGDVLAAAAGDRRVRAAIAAGAFGYGDLAALLVRDPAPIPGPC